MIDSDPIDRQTLAQRTYARLRREIMDGLLPPGMRLDERALCDRLKVSRTPLRNALERLHHDGLVERTSYQGTFVRSFNPEEAENLYIVRATLEQLAIRLATQRASAAEITKIRDIAIDCESAVDRGDSPGLNDADQSFHKAIVEASHNAVLIRMLAELRQQIHAIRSFANQDIQVAKRTVDERLMICSALEARDADAAATLLGVHIDGVRESVLAELRAIAAGHPENAAAARQEPAQWENTRAERRE